MRKRELEVLREKLLDVGAADRVRAIDFGDTDDLSIMSISISFQTVATLSTYMYRTETGTVTSSHVLIKRLDSVGSAHLTELLVHVVGTRARVVTDPDTKVLDLERTFLVDLKRVVSAYAPIVFGIPH